MLGKEIVPSGPIMVDSFPVAVAILGATAVHKPSNWRCYVLLPWFSCGLAAEGLGVCCTAAEGLRCMASADRIVSGTRFMALVLAVRPGLRGRGRSMCGGAAGIWSLAELC